MNPEDFVRAHNPSDEAIDVAGTMFQANADKMVSFPWMRNHYGDPRSVPTKHLMFKAADGTMGSVQPREVERLHINHMWDIRPDGRSWADIPVLEFYDIDGNRVFTVYDDPAGDLSSPSTTTIDEQRELERTIKRQQAQIDQLLALSGLDHDALPADDADLATNLPTDDSTTLDTQSPWAKAEVD